MIAIKDRVRFVETDLMGVVHHSNYLRWFEMGRVEYMRRAGVLLHELMDAGYVFPITEVHCHYKKSARFDDEIVIHAHLTALNRAKMSYAYEIKLALDDTVLVTGTTTNFFTKMDGTVARLPKEFYEKLANFYEKQINGGR